MIPVEGGGGSIRCPAPQNVMNMNLPMDTNKNRYEKPVQTPGWGGGGAKWPTVLRLHRR